MRDSHTSEILPFYDNRMSIAIPSIFRDEKVIINIFNKSECIFNKYLIILQFYVWKFKGGAPESFWRDLNNQRMYMERLSEEFGLKDKEEWKNIKKKSILEKEGASSLLHQYKGSLQSCLYAIYPELDNEKKKNTTREWGYWRDISNRRKFFDQVFIQLKLKR